MSELQYEPMEHSEKIRWMLETAGWLVEPVRAVDDATDPFPTYSYTVGLEALVGHPEIAIFGLSAVASRGLLEMTVGQLTAGVRLPLDQPFVGLLDNQLRSMLVTIDLGVHGDRFPTPAAVYGLQPWRMTQLVWPHSNGAFPWEDQWPHEMRLLQPVLASE
ncbi:MAG: DUF4262 domain-containing protein [Actinomycetota bacterium]|jgi:hypothetical protein|nr:DUF4262 domain-containing protein [Actinomycetota bacterium]